MKKLAEYLIEFNWKSFLVRVWVDVQRLGVNTSKEPEEQLLFEKYKKLLNESDLPASSAPVFTKDVADVLFEEEEVTAIQVTQKTKDGSSRGIVLYKNWP